MSDYVIRSVTTGLISALQGITTAAGYQTDIGASNVHQRLIDDQDDTFPLIVLRMPTLESTPVTMGPTGYNRVTYTAHLIAIVEESTDAVTNGLDLLQDIEKAVRAWKSIDTFDAKPYEREAGQTLQGHAIKFTLPINIGRADPTEEH